MLIKNAKIFLNKSFVEGDISFKEKVEKIGELDGEPDIDAGANYIIPGLVDIHTHGAIGEDFADAKSDGLNRLSDYYASRGVTGFLATTVTVSASELVKAIYCIRNFKRENGAKCYGIHLEGPFLSYSKRGAHSSGNLLLPDYELFSRLNEASGKRIKLITVAPELKGAGEFIHKVAKNCTVSLGHTAADYETAREAFKAGATHVTHIFNAMPPFLHRAPGVVGAALDCGASVELICDGLHVLPPVVRAVYRMFGDKLDLISDSLRCAGMPDGNYELGGKPVVVLKGKATLTDGTLAGSSISLMDALRNAVAFGLPLEDAVYASSTAPAKAVGIKAGKISVGAPADLVMLDKKLNIVTVFIDGKKWSGFHAPKTIRAVF